jgi:hypothetical protein
MKKSTSQDIDQIREKVFEQYPNDSLSNFGLIYVEDRWIMGLILNGIRFVGEGNTPQDAHAALIISLERHQDYVENLEKLDSAFKDDKDGNSNDHTSDRVDSNISSN